MGQKPINPAWEAGYQAYFDGSNREDNPYFADDSQEETDWDEGWYAAWVFAHSNS